MQARRAGGAIVIHIVNRDLGHAELVEDALAAGAIAVAVARNALVDIVIVDLGVEESFDAGFEAEFCIVDLTSGFDEFGEAYAEDVGW